MRISPRVIIPEKYSTIRMDAQKERFAHSKTALLNKQAKDGPFFTKK